MKKAVVTPARDHQAILDYMYKAWFDYFKPTHTHPPHHTHTPRPPPPMVLVRTEVQITEVTFHFKVPLSTLTIKQ